MKRLRSLKVYSLLLTLLMLCSVARSQLRTDFYASSCPNVFRILRKEVQKTITNEMRIAASLLRLQFHDCFVNVSSTVVAFVLLVSCLQGGSRTDFLRGTKQIFEKCLYIFKFFGALLKFCEI